MLFCRPAFCRGGCSSVPWWIHWGAQVLQAVCPWAPRMHKWPFFAHRGTWTTCSTPQLQQGVIVELPHLMNAMANIYLHFSSKTLSPASSQHCSAIYLILSRSLDGDGRSEGASLGEAQSTLDLAKHLSFGHFRCPTGLCAWLKQAPKSFPWLKTDVLLSPSFMAHPVQCHRHHKEKGFCVMDILLWNLTAGMSSLPRAFLCIHTF